MKKHILLSMVSLTLAFFVFIVPFIFILLTAMKDPAEASRLTFTWPSSFHIWENIKTVFQAREYMLVTAFINSTMMTVGSVTLLVIFAAMVGFVLQRRKSRWNRIINFFVLFGLMVPPAVVPTIWLLQEINLFKTLHGIILIQVAYGLSFSILLFRAFISTIPKEMDEAAIIDGAGPVRLFFGVILPMLKPVVVTNIVIHSVLIFNDFVNPLYYLPGRENATVQLTLYNFQSQYNTDFNLLFMNIAIITIPPLLVFVFFNRQIVEGMTAGAVKG